MGQMDSMDYIREDMPRSMRQSQMEHKAWEAQANLEYKLRQARNRQNAARLQRVQSAAGRAGADGRGMAGLGRAPMELCPVEPGRRFRLSPVKRAVCVGQNKRVCAYEAHTLFRRSG